MDKINTASGSSGASRACKRPYPSLGVQNKRPRLSHADQNSVLALRVSRVFSSPLRFSYLAVRPLEKKQDWRESLCHRIGEKKLARPHFDKTGFCADGVSWCAQTEALTETQQQEYSAYKKWFGAIAARNVPENRETHDNDLRPLRLFRLTPEFKKADGLRCLDAKAFRAKVVSDALYQLTDDIWQNFKIIAECIDKSTVEVNITDKDGKTALMLAVEHNDPELFKLLINKTGVDANLQDNRGYTALIYAAKGGYTGVIDQLFGQDDKFHIDVNVQCREGKTALMIALRNGYDSVVDRLLAKGGFDFDLQDHGGNTVWFYAESRKRMIDKLNRLRDNLAVDKKEQ